MRSGCCKHCYRGNEVQPWIELRQTRPKLLLVDDQPLNIRVLNELFRFDCEVYMATRGEQAISICQQQQPDLVLLDVVMEGMDGHQVCQALKADPATSHIPIIFVSAKGEENDEAQGLEMGAVDYISKPFNPIIVRARVNTHLTLKLQNDYLRNLASLDGLTGIANRRIFDERLASAWRQACRASTPLSLLMIDIDCFKQFNDHFGHLQGDQCLKRVASALATSVGRPYDLVARYGGEEFICLLPDTDTAGALQIAQNLQAQIESLQIEHPASTAADLITLSIGAATVQPALHTDSSQLLQAADAELYKAKHAGRNRISVAAADDR